MTDASPPAKGNSRVLLITRNLPPLIGGMEKLNLHLVQELAEEFDVMVVGPAGCGAFLPSGVCLKQVPHKPLWRFLSAALVDAMRLARRYRPGCVMAGSGLTAPIAFVASRMCAARAAVYVHGLDLVASHRIYRSFWLPFLRRMDLCIANSRNTAELAASIGIPRERISVVHPGVELPHEENQEAAAKFRKQQGLESKKILLSVGRMTPRKGLLEFVERALPVIFEAYPESVLVVIGNEAPDALSGSSAGAAARIERAAENKGLCVRLLGASDDLVLSSAYQAANLHVFPLREVPGDVEGFGMVAIEAASYGLPTVAFSVGGVRDAVGEGRSGWLVPPDNYQALAERVIQVMAHDHDEVIRQQCRDFAQAFDRTRFGEHIRASIRGLYPQCA